jgi:hypothetical protein
LLSISEPLQLIKGHILDAGQIEQAVEEHRGVAVGQHEPVAVQPIWIRRIELHEVPEKNGRDVGHAHRRAGMTAFGLLHGIHGKEPNAIGHIPQVLIAGLEDRFDGLRGRGVSHDWNFLFQEIDRGEGGWQRLRGRPNRQAIRLECFPLSRSLVARDSKPEESDSFRLAG